MTDTVGETRTYKFYISKWGKFGKWATISFDNQVSDEDITSIVYCTLMLENDDSKWKFTDEDIVCIYNVNTPENKHYIELYYESEYFKDYADDDEYNGYVPAALYTGTITENEANNKFKDRRGMETFNFPYIERDWLAIWSHSFHPFFNLKETNE